MDLNEAREELAKSISEFFLSYGIEPVYVLVLVFGVFLYSSTRDFEKDNSDHFDWIYFVFSLWGFLLCLIFSLVRIFE